MAVDIQTEVIPARAPLSSRVGVSNGFPVYEAIACRDSSTEFG